MRVGLVGAGNMMQITHLPSLLQIADVELVALAELDRARAEKLAAAYRIPRICGSAGDLADYAGELDCAVVVTLKEHHAAAIIPLLEAGVPVFTEKPLAGSREDAEQIRAASMRTGTPVMVGYMRQFDPAVQLAKKTACGTANRRRAFRPISRLWRKLADGRGDAPCPAHRTATGRDRPGLNRAPFSRGVPPTHAGRVDRIVGA